MIEYIKKIYEWLETSGASFGDVSKIQMVSGLVTEEYEEFIQAHKENNDDEIVDAFVDLVWVLANNTYFRGIHLERVERMFELVMLSNFSKFAKTELEASETVLDYQAGNHFDKPGVKINTYYKKVNDHHFVIKRTEDDKVLKSKNYNTVSYLDLIM